MKMKQKALTWTALFMLAGTALSGCGKGGAATTPTSTPSAKGDEAKKASNPVELGVAMWSIQDGFNAPNAKDDTIFNNLQSKFNVKINPVQITWNDWQDKLKVWAASKQLPDVFVNAIATDNPGLYQTWAKQGVVKALPDDMSAYPNLQKILALPSVQPLKVNGKFYMIPRMTYNDSSDWSMDRVISYRKDWAAEAGYTSDPSSFEDFMAMAKAVMKKHPGIAGLTTNNTYFLLTQFLGSFPEMSNPKAWVKEDGKWIPSFVSTKAYTGIKQLRTLYSEGVLDKDFAIAKDGDGVTKFLSGQSFAVYSNNFMTKDESITQFAKANPGVSASKAVGYMNIWPAADGKRYTWVETPYWSETYFSSSISDEKLQSALKMMDYMASEEFAGQVFNGIENVDYKIENGKAVSLLKEKESLGDKYPITKNFGVLGAWNNGFIYTGKKVPSSNGETAAFEQATVDTFNKFKSMDTPTPINFDVTLLSTPAKDKLGAVLGTLANDITKVILKDGDPVAEWQEIVKGYDAKGVQDAIKEVNEEVAKRGIK